MTSKRISRQRLPAIVANIEEPEIDDGIEPPELDDGIEPPEEGIAVLAPGIEYDSVTHRYLTKDNLPPCQRAVKNKLRTNHPWYRAFKDHDFSGASIEDALNSRSEDELLSVVQLSKQPIDWSLNLLGWRWLERECGVLIIAPSGAGKSVLDMQAAINWACGREAFGIRCQQPLRQIIFQHEDRQNDVIEMSRLVAHLKLTADEMKMVSANLRITRVMATGDRFIERARRYCRNFQPDLIHVNPMGVYMGQGFQDDDATKSFLYGKIDPLLQEYHCGLLGIVHTPKPTKSNAQELSLTQELYAMSGRSWWTNWARATINISPVTDKERVYNFLGGKRWDRLGWESRSTIWRWNPPQEDGREKTLLWLPATDAQTVDAISGKKLLPKDLFILFPPPPDFVTTESMYAKVNEHRQQNNNRIKEIRVRAMLEALAADNLVIRTEFQRPCGGRPEIQYALPG